ncbi:nucleotidyltransferase domain-containing protein [Butyrivibrio sp. MC2013]|uniref:nucleotidyltransferase domain-containing protein n=1 Tax=Butyrivibrio sp. MC2013 TaxID=1280686 RepID=UPI000401A70B|nr:nucleotidyltransferase family protein [Butyrivibrio sp. MC2013]
MNYLLMMDYLADLIKAEFDKTDIPAIPEGISFDELFDVAGRGQILYMVLSGVIQTDIPEEVKEHIRPVLVRSTLKTLAQVTAARELEEALEANGVRNQVLKGTVLKQIYPRPEMREMSDIDFMVYDETMDHSTEVVKALGYEMDKAISHHIIFHKKPFLMVEMHWSLYDKHVDKGQYLYFKDNFRSVKKEGAEYTYEFTNEDFYVYMISHMAKHFYEQGCGVRNLLDIYVYWNKYGAVMNQEILKAELSRCGLVDFEEHMKNLAYIWLDKRKSNKFYNDLFAYMLDCGIYGKGENGVWGQLAKDKGGASGKDAVLRYYFPSIDRMKEHYPVLEKAPFLLPATWIHRGITGVSDKSKMDRRKKLVESSESRATDMISIYKKLKLDFNSQ